MLPPNGFIDYFYKIFVIFHVFSQYYLLKKRYIIEQDLFTRYPLLAQVY